jgi:hypothetical protein
MILKPQLTTYVGTILLLLILSTSSFAQSIEGDWYGVADIQGVQLRLTIHDKASVDDYTTTFDSQDQGTFGEEGLKQKYDKQEIYITMRDGVRLFTSIYTPKNSTVKHPILLNRTPYNIESRGAESYNYFLQIYRRYVEEEYIMVFQDLRGRYMSEGVFEDIRPVIPFKKTNKDIVETTDTWDTVDWLVKNVDNNNGRVGRPRQTPTGRGDQGFQWPVPDNYEFFLSLDQILYNGRIWRNLYSGIRGDQFLFSSDFQQGSVNIGNKIFIDVELRYDIYNDELHIRTDQNIILQMNKEMVDAFTIRFNSRTYDFIKQREGSANEKHGYLNILYNGRLKLYVKYRKEILLLAVDNKYDLFTQMHRIYLEKDDEMHPVRKKKDIIDLFSDEKQKIRSFMKNNKVTVSRKDPDSFVRLVEFCDNL